MSGMEPLVVLGLVCNVLQLIETGRDTLNLIKTVYQSGSVDETLTQRAVILASISDDIKPVQPVTKSRKHEQQLLDTVIVCSKAARDLQEEIHFLVGHWKQGSLKSTLKVALKVSWRRRRLDRLKNDLDRAETLMQTGLLARIW